MTNDAPEEVSPERWLWDQLSRMLPADQLNELQQGYAIARRKYPEVQRAERSSSARLELDQEWLHVAMHNSYQSFEILPIRKRIEYSQRPSDRKANYMNLQPDPDRYRCGTCTESMMWDESDWLCRECRNCWEDLLVMLATERTSNLVTKGRELLVLTDQFQENRHRVSRYRALADRARLASALRSRGRPRDQTNEWVREQVYTLGRDPNDVFPEWVRRRKSEGKMRTDRNVFNEVLERSPKIPKNESRK